MIIRPRRSVLYVPGANRRALEKAGGVGADSLIFDLEDSVAPEAKAQARENVADALRSKFHGAEVVMRINGLDTRWARDDLKLAAALGPNGLLVPKVSRPGDIVTAAQLYVEMGGPGETRLWAMIETPLAMLNLAEIAAASAEARLSCLVLGTNDLAKETRAAMTGGRFAMLPSLALAVLAARAHGLDVIDGVYNDFRDQAGFRDECVQGRTLGMDGKTLIHPDQVAPCNEIFAPSTEELRWSRAVIAAFANPENAGQGVISIEGRMVERLHLASAMRIEAIAKAIAAA